MKRAAGGVTLLELLMVLSLAAIVMATAMPSVQELLQRLRLRTAVSDLCSAIDLTRTQALARGAPVLLAPRDPGGVDWKQGWVVFIDANGNRRPDPSEQWLLQQGPVADGIVIHSSFSSGAAPFYLAYNGAGRSCNAANSLAAHWGTLSLSQGQNVRHIKINMLGRVRVCDPQLQASGCSAAAAAQ